MNETETRSEPTIAAAFDMTLEVVVIPVSNVDRAKRFYTDLGWRSDLDYVAGDEYRVIQFTPPGSLLDHLRQERYFRSSWLGYGIAPHRFGHPGRAR